jgi:hypothetical protein
VEEFYWMRLIKVGDKRDSQTCSPYFGLPLPPNSHLNEMPSRTFAFNCQVVSRFNLVGKSASRPNEIPRYNNENRMMKSKRRILSRIEREMVERWIAATVPTRLYPNQRECFLSVKQYFDWDQKLSDKQLSSLRKAKYTSDKVGRLLKQPINDFDISDRFNAVFNPVRS